MIVPPKEATCPGPNSFAGSIAGAAAYWHLQNCPNFEQLQLPQFVGSPVWLQPVVAGPQLSPSFGSRALHPVLFGSQIRLPLQSCCWPIQVAKQALSVLPQAWLQQFGSPLRAQQPETHVPSADPVCPVQSCDLMQSPPASANALDGTTRIAVPTMTRGTRRWS
jgi:hypothetical protein